MDEGRKRVIGIMAAILGTMHMRNADDMFGGRQGVLELISSSPPQSSGRG